MKPILAAVLLVTGCHREQAAPRFQTMQPVGFRDGPTVILRDVERAPWPIGPTVIIERLPTPRIILL